VLVPDDYVKRARASIAKHVRAILDLQEHGASRSITE